MALRRYVLRKALEPAYTQLALNGTKGPLADERVRRAVARAIDREALAKAVLKPFGLPAEPLGSHLRWPADGYKDNSGALGGQDTEAAQSLLADAGWHRGGSSARQKRTTARRTTGSGQRSRATARTRHDSPGLRRPPRHGRRPYDGL